MWRSRLPFWVKEAPHWLHWKGRSPGGKNTQETHVTVEGHTPEDTQKKSRKFVRILHPVFILLVSYQAGWVFSWHFMASLSLVSPCFIFPLITIKAQELCLCYVDDKAGGCCWGNMRSLHYKHPERQNKPDDGVSAGWSYRFWEGFTAEWHSISPCSPCPTDFWRSDRTRAFQTQPASSVMHHCLGQFDLKISFFPLLRL